MGFPGRNPATASTQNPTVSYTTAGTFNTTLTAWSNITNRGNKKVKTAFINVTAAPLAPSQPSGIPAFVSTHAEVTYHNDPTGQRYSV